MKKTLVIGASTNPSRYSYMATLKLRNYGHEVVAFGLRNGMIGDVEIQTILPEISDIHTVTLYVGPDKQEVFYDYILMLNPKRVIFNPGTYNEELEQKLTEKEIEVVSACTLVMLSGNLF